MSAVYPPADPADLADLGTRLTVLERNYSRLDRAWTAALDAGGPVTADAAVGGDGPELVFDDVAAWVEQYFVLVFPRSIGGEYRWCRQWWKHREAVTHFEALWRSWETAIHDPNTGVATWLRDQLDHQQRMLMGPSGPFARCNPEQHEPDKALPVTPPTPGWRDDL